MVPGHAVADGTHATGVGADVPAQRRRLFAGRHRVDETQGSQLLVELLEGDPGLDHGDLVLGVDLADVVHPVEGQQDAVAHRDGGPGEPGPAAPGDHGHALLVGAAQDLDDLIGRTGQDQGQRRLGRGAERLVVGVVGVHGVAGHDVAVADRLAQLLEEIRHEGRSHLSTSGPR